MSILKQVTSEIFQATAELTLSCRRHYCCCFSEPTGDTRL